MESLSLTTYDIAVGLISLYPHVVARRENMSELVQGCHAHICNPLHPLFPLSSTPPPLLSFSPPPSSPSPPLVAHSSDYQNPMLHRSWNSCGATFPVGLIPWERRRSSIRVTRRSPWQFVMCAAAEDNHSKPGAVCPQVSWWEGGWGDSDTRIDWSCCVTLSPMFYYAWPFQLL